jgi:poly(3-hydroxyalkanoate) synthetase
LIVHGTRGHKGMEIIQTLSSRLFEEGHDILSINLSYGFSNRHDDFLACDINHNHNEHESVEEIITWYKYLIKKGYNQINFIGHSRGGLNVMQALSIIDNKKIKSYLLAPVIDTYKGTKAYYEKELGIPYDLIINSNENYNLADRLTFYFVKMSMFHLKHSNHIWTFLKINQHTHFLLIFLI